MAAGLTALDVEQPDPRDAPFGSSGFVTQLTDFN
jgi:hypothetical protein